MRVRIVQDILEPGKPALAEQADFCQDRCRAFTQEAAGQIIRFGSYFGQRRSWLRLDLICR